MDVFKLIFLAVILTECVYSIKAMGLCAFADKFPCDENEGSKCFKNSGCKRQNSTKKIQPSTQSTSKQSSSEYPTHDTVSNDKEFTGHSTSGQGTTGFAATSKQPSRDFSTPDKVSTDENFTGHSATGQGTTPDRAITTSPLCPPNMVFANCTTCQSTCRNPNNCIISNCTEPETCVCPNGFLLHDGDCVPKEECGCFLVGKVVIPEGGVSANSNCTTGYACNNGQLIRYDNYSCDSNAVCRDTGTTQNCHCNVGYVGDGQSCRNPDDCGGIYNAGITDSGVYLIKPTSWPETPFEVYCNISDGGGWTVFQRRIDGATDFYQDWESYKDGFGSADHELWLGNEKLFYLTNQRRYSIRIDVVNQEGDSYYAKFDNFRVNDENDNYRLSQLGTYTGTADSRSFPDGGFLRRQLNESFSTRDRDNDRFVNHSAQQFHSGWWHGLCTNSNLNGLYNAGEGSDKSIFMKFLPGSQDNISFTEMKIKAF